MKKNSLVSVIVPIYNAEKYLERCIKSLINQTYQDIEIILVNDGSTDKSLDICKKYAEKDSRIVVINKENTGVSDSRNRAINIAKGEYIQFTDSDDWLENTMLEKMIESATTNRSDIVISGYFNYIEKTKTKEPVLLKKYPSYSFKSIISDENTLYGGFPWNKLIKKTCIKKLYRTDVHFYENLLFFLENSKYINKYSVVDECLYYYNINDNSTVHTKKYNIKRASILVALPLIIDIVDDKYKDIYRYLYVSKFNENYYKAKINNCDLKVFEDYRKKEIEYYNKLKLKNNLSVKARLKLFIIKKMPVFYRIIKKIKEG